MTDESDGHPMRGIAALLLPPMALTCVRPGVCAFVRSVGRRRCRY